MLNKKNEKIFVDLDDEITFVFERVKLSDADRIVLVAPEGAAIISSLVSLKLLSKLVFKNGKSLVLVTTDDGGIKFAKKAQIPVVNRITNLNEDIWLSSESKLKKRGMYPILGKKKISLEKEKEEEQNLPENSTVANPPNKDIDANNQNNQIENQSEPITEENSQEARLKKASTEQENLDKEPTLKDFGFVVGKDIAKQETNNVTADDLDNKKSNYYNETFQKRDDFSTKLNQKTEVNEEDGARDVNQEEQQEFGEGKARFKLGFPRLSFPKISLKFFIPIIALIFLFAGIGGIYAYFIAPTATIDLDVKFQSVDLEKEIIATAEVSDVDLGNLKIPLILQEVEESGSDSVSVTGKEIRGEKAKGKITIVNKTEESIQLAAGTVLTGSGYNFLLISAQEIPAADIFAGTLGRAEVNIEAYDIGEEYNLTAGTEFSIEGYLTGALVGKNFDQISGGVKEEVTIVTAQDQETLKDRLKQSLEERARNNVKNQISEGLVLNEGMIDIEIVEENFDAAVGDETDSMNLNMKVKAKGYVYSVGDFKTLAVQLLQQEIKTGLKLLEDESEFDGEFLRREDSNAVLKLAVNGVIVGDVDEKEIKESIVGKSLQEAEVELSSLGGVDSFKVFAGPEWLPERFRHIPSIKGKIIVNLIVNGRE